MAIELIAPTVFRIGSGVYLPGGNLVERRSCVVRNQKVPVPFQRTFLIRRGVYYRLWHHPGGVRSPRGGPVFNSDPKGEALQTAIAGLVSQALTQMWNPSILQRNIRLRRGSSRGFGLHLAFNLALAL